MGYETKQSKALRDYLETTGGRHISAAEIVNALPVRMGTATVYRRLEQLVEQGLVRKYSMEGEPACYQYVGNASECSNHYHLKCSVCGKLIHMDCKSFARLTGHIYEEHGFLVDPLRTALYGTCKDCLQAETRKEHHE